MKVKKVLFVSFFIIFLFSCKNEKRKADISGFDFEVKIDRFDVDFWQLDTANFDSSIENLCKKYPNLLPKYIERSLLLDAWDNAESRELLRTVFFADTTIHRLYSDCLSQFSDVSKFENELTFAFRRGKYFFPKMNIPRVAFHVSAGANPEVLLHKDSLISISIDNYLGENYPLYENVVFDYLKQNMHAGKIVSDIVTVWITMNYPFVPQNGMLLEELLYRGKIMYILSLLLPDEKEENLIGFTAEQWRWAVEQERDMWLYMIEKKHLFSSEALLATRYLNDAPFTSFFSQESPGRCGVFLGWRIIESYMTENQNVTPLELMKNTDYKTILEKSFYKP